MNYLTNTVAVLLLISAVATPMVLVVFLLKPVNSRYQTLKWKNFILKMTLLLFFVPVYSLFGEINFPEKMLEIQEPVTTAPFLPKVAITPEKMEIQEVIRVHFVDMLPIFSILWLIAVIISIFFQCYCYRKFENSIKSARQTEDEILLTMLSSESEKLGIHRNIPLFSSHNVASPMVTGVFSPKIYVPEGKQ